MAETSSHSERLRGKIALVTGGSRGIGAGIAKRLAAEGAQVAISYSAAADAANAVVDHIVKQGGKAHAFKADATHPNEIKQLIKDVVSRFGRIDILVNNAGVFVGKPVEEISDAEYDQVFDVNVRAVFTAVREASPHIPDGGRIITIGSVNGQRAPITGVALYSATKFAVQGFTRGWSREFAARNITVNVIQPGPIDTDLNPETGPFAEILLPMVPLGRYGKTDEVGALTAFLASPEASYITGAAINIDGGMEA
jgi:3-oxoacyl-[acyl-carrier protein] reductase